MRIYLLILILFVSACSGYRMQSRSNPFARYGIKSIHIPMFYNQSNISNVGAIFNNEISKVLSSFRDLQLSQGFEKSDAVLIGIITSQAKLKDTISILSSRRAKDTFGNEAIGDQRNDFEIPGQNQMRLSLRIMVLKHPTQSEIKFLQSSLGVNAKSSKIIFNETINVVDNYSLKELNSNSFEVLGSQNRGLQRQLKRTLALQASQSFKDMILYAF